MNFEQLKTFLSVAEKKSFSDTARTLHLSQPTVTSQIKSLENYLNITLFERSTKQVELTPPAKILYDQAKEIIKLCELAETKILSMSDEVHGRLGLSCSLTIGETILSQILLKFTKEFPLIKVNVDITNTQHILEKIKNNSLDLGLIEASVEDPDLVLEPFMEDELLLIASPAYFDSQKQDVTLTELVQLPFIFRERGSGTRQVLEQHLIREGINPTHLNIILELGSTEAVKTVVESGLGVSIISKSSIKKEIQLHLLKTYTIQNIPLLRYFYMVYRKDRVLKPTATVFRQTIDKLMAANNKICV